MHLQGQAGQHVYRTTDWRGSFGEVIELRRLGCVYKRGRVDAVMEDGSGLWLAADGPDSRVYVHKDNSLELWVECRAGIIAAT